LKRLKNSLNVLFACLAQLCIQTGPLFVDSGGSLKYSEDLARCCAWGLCVLTRTQLVDAPGGDSLEQATGC